MKQNKVEKKERMEERMVKWKKKEKKEEKFTKDATCTSIGAAKWLITHSCAFQFPLSITNCAPEIVRKCNKKATPLSNAMYKYC